MYRNARFWAWVNGGWVKLTLRGGDELTNGGGGPTEEGYWFWSTRWSHCGSYVLEELHIRSRDCDGPHEHHECYRAELEQLGANEAPDGTRVPAWSRSFAGQRDHTAEAAGY